MPNPRAQVRRAGEALISRIGRHELPLLALPGLAAGAAWAFIELADEVSEGDTRALDRALLLALRRRDDPSDPLGAHWVEELARDATAFGGVGPLVFITLAVVLYLVFRRKAQTALFVALAVGGGQLLSGALKLGFDRPRPDLVTHEVAVYTASFPSGHAMMAAVTYLTLGALVARVEPGRRIKAYVLLIAVTVTLLVGVSRIYLGVHWPSDVLGGWTAGSAWASVCWTLALVLQRFGRLERETGAESADGAG